MLSNSQNSLKATKMDILVTLPNNYEKGKEVAREFLSGKVVVVNFVRMSAEDKQRVFDYLNGAAYVTHADIKQVTTDTIVYIPATFGAMKIRL